MTSTYDHRIIQGAESGRFLQRIEALLQGEDGFYERVFADLGVPLGPPAPAPARRARPRRRPASAVVAAAPRVDEELLQAVQAATSLLKAHRTHRSPRRQARSARPGARGRPGARTRAARADARADGSGSRRGSCACTSPARRSPTRCRICARPTAGRSPTRSSTSPRTGSGCGCARRSSRASSASRSPPTSRRRCCRRLTEVDALERFMHKAYLGQKQFSIEGLDMTVPMLDELIQLSATRGAREVVIGMAHRGRLNVLAHNLGRPYDTIFAEFEGTSTLEPITTIPQGGTGDVKYHHGAQGSYQLPERRVDHRPARVEPVPPRVRRAGRGGRHPRGPDHAPGPARASRHERRGAGDPARRRRVPGPGRRRRDAQPPGARRLHRRRDDPPHPEQPGRLHDRSRRLPLDALGVGPRQGLRRADHPRQRRRRRRRASRRFGWRSRSARSSATTC